jgi:hypothetical protein
MLVAKLYNEFGLRDSVGCELDSLGIAFDEAKQLKCMYISLFSGENCIAKYESNDFFESFKKDEYFSFDYSELSDNAKQNAVENYSKIMGVYDKLKTLEWFKKKYRRLLDVDGTFIGTLQKTKW